MQGNTIFGILSGVFTLVAVFAMLAIVIVTEVLIIMRFYRLLGDDGYFWFSLPVTPAQHMMVKLIAAMVWSFASVALFVGGIFAFVLVANSMENGAVLAELWAALRFTTTLGPVFGVLGLFWCWPRCLTWPRAACRCSWPVRWACSGRKAALAPAWHVRAVERGDANFVDSSHCGRRRVSGCQRAAYTTLRPWRCPAF